MAFINRLIYKDLFNTSVLFVPHLCFIYITQALQTSHTSVERTAYLYAIFLFLLQRYFFPFTSLLITVEKLSKEQGKKFKNNSCNIQNNVYAPTRMNIPKKLRETFRGYINTFFSPITPVYNHKVINFALYQQGVERVL